MCIFLYNCVVYLYMLYWLSASALGQKEVKLDFAENTNQFIEHSILR